VAFVVPFISVSVTLCKYAVYVSCFADTDYASPSSFRERKFSQLLEALIPKIFVMVMNVTGPASATSTVLFVSQSYGIYLMSKHTDMKTEVPSLTIAAIGRLITRHAFFATNHACFFSRLQYSSAFIFTDTFYYAPAGICLFINTFGWEILGSILCLYLFHGEKTWKWFSFYQLCETVGSCISVSVLRRHLMVWATFAPRFVFAAVFMLINLTLHLIHLLLAVKRDERSVGLKEIKEKNKI